MDVTVLDVKEFPHPADDILELLQSNGLVGRHADTFYAYNSEHGEFIKGIPTKGTRHHLFTAHHE